MKAAIRFRIRQWLRGHSLLWRRPARRARSALSVLKYRLLNVINGPQPARVLPRPANQPADSLIPPLIGIVPGQQMDPERLAACLGKQTESSWTLDPDKARTTPFLWLPDALSHPLEATHLEAMVLTAVAHDLDLTVAGWASVEGELQRPEGLSPADLTLLRRPCASTNPVTGRLIPYTTHTAFGMPIRLPSLSSGPWLLDHRGDSGAVLSVPCQPIYRRLSRVAATRGPRTALFLLPFLAVGGAERLLFDLLSGLGDRFRSLVVTLEPHRAELGTTVEACRRLTPHTYTLGDWIERESRWSAVQHLIRRWRVECLVSWNGTVDFYDHAEDLGADLPELRILAQLYNHAGGWIDHLSHGLIGRVDGHLAVNDRIAAALVNRGIPAEKAHTVHHGVEIPTLAPPDRRAELRRRRRQQLGIPENAFVAGTFVRMHPQKRPLDVIRLARRMAGSNTWFLLVGGGPMDEIVDREISRDPPPNLVRLSMQNDARPLFDVLDVCLMTSEYEGLPVFLLEGLAREIPCVSTNTGEVGELLANGGGILVPDPGDLESLEMGLEKMLDPEVRRREGERGRRTVARQFSLERFVSQYERLLFP